MAEEPPKLFTNKPKKCKIQLPIFFTNLLFGLASIRFFFLFWFLTDLFVCSGIWTKNPTHPNSASQTISRSESQGLFFTNIILFHTVVVVVVYDFSASAAASAERVVRSALQVPLAYASHRQSRRRRFHFSLSLSLACLLLVSLGFGFHDYLNEDIIAF